MTDVVMNKMQTNEQSSQTRAANASDAVRKGLKKRYAAEARFRAYGIGAIGLALTAVAILFYTIISSGLPTFTESRITLEINLNEQVIDPSGTRDHQTLVNANYRKIVLESLMAHFPDVSGRRDRRAVTAILSRGASFEVQQQVVQDPSLIGKVVEFELPVSADFDLYHKGVIHKGTDEVDRRISDKQMAWFDKLEKDGIVHSRFNTTFFTNADSREPELAGIWGATMGTLLTMLVTLGLSFPIGVAAAVYLEEFAPKEFEYDPVSRLVRGDLALESRNFRRNEPRRQSTGCQPR